MMRPGKNAYTAYWADRCVECNGPVNRGCHVQVKELSLSYPLELWVVARFRRDKQLTKSRRPRDTFQFPYRYCGYVAPINGSAEDKRVKAFHELQACDLTPDTLQEEMSAKGYVLIRGILPRDAVNSVLSDVMHVVAAADWLLPSHAPEERIANAGAACGDPDPTFKRVYQEVFSLESFHALPHQPALRGMMKMLVGEQPFVHPKPIGRLIFPHCERLVTHAHQDYEFRGARLPRRSRSLADPGRLSPNLAFRSMKGRTSAFQRFPGGKPQETDGLAAR